MALDVILSNQRGLVDTNNPIPVAIVSGSSGGGGGGSALADTLLTDANNVLFIARDNGSVISYVRLDTNSAYTPVAPIRASGPVGAATDASITSAATTNHADLLAFSTANHADLVALLARVTPYTITQTVVAVTAASQQVVAANPNRKYLAWMVVGAADVTVTAGAASAVMGLGLVYQAGGASKQGGSEEFPNGVPGNAFQCIAAGTGSNLIIWEGV